MRELVAIELGYTSSIAAATGGATARSSAPAFALPATAAASALRKAPVIDVHLRLR
jgi:hypothetical protein